jgi:hypothetical protein
MLKAGLKLFVEDVFWSFIGVIEKFLIIFRFSNRFEYIK